MVYPFYSEIESHISEITIDIGYNEKETKIFNIEVKGEENVQVNVASDHGKIEVTQINKMEQNKA